MVTVRMKLLAVKMSRFSEHAWQFGAVCHGSEEI